MKGGGKGITRKKLETYCDETAKINSLIGTKKERERELLFLKVFWREVE